MANRNPNPKRPLSSAALAFKQDLQLYGKGDRTQEFYVRAIRKFSEFLQRDPDTASEVDLRRYVLYIKNDLKWKPSTLNVAYNGLKLYFKLIRQRDWPTLKKLRVPKQENLPTVLTTAIGNRRIVNVIPGPDGKGIVTFTVRRSGTSVYKPMQVSAEEFLRRFLQHVLPSGFQKVRHFGFAHPRAKTDWEWLAMMVTVTLNMVYVLTVWAMAPIPKRMMLCPECGGELICLGFVPSTTRRLAMFDSS